MCTKPKRKKIPSNKTGECPSCSDLRAEIEELKARIEERKIVEKAKWILVKLRGVSENEALDLLRASARQNQKTLIEIANNLITGEKILNSGTEPEHKLHLNEAGTGKRQENH